jgi:AcrR family transcriptional regulator
MKKVTGGRPTKEEAGLLSEKIVAAASQLMLEHGYHGTSIESVANAAGVAKRTLYSRFPDKRDLFVAVIERRRAQFLAPVSRIFAAGGAIEEQLTLIGQHMLDWALKPDTVALKRLMAAEVERFPELAATMHDVGREQTIDAIATVLDAAERDGALKMPDIRFAAMQFLEMVMGPADILAHYGRPAHAGMQREQYIDQVVDIFLNGCRVRETQLAETVAKKARSKKS